MGNMLIILYLCNSKFEVKLNFIWKSLLKEPERQLVYNLLPLLILHASPQNYITMK
jgi:hypothetical protein